ncbi:kinase-like protein [Cystobasidium minutum MCA 4210]|uniref:kinase-like protein n=1 Tax=Cystobasidium minutum MCA 4210 TaxID=1397322 RepID=UPI0034CDDC5F|eukprot:jgi/Rhomi1/199114/gm1.7328_g
MKIVTKSLISDQKQYIRVLQRLDELYAELRSDDILRTYEWFESMSKYYIALEMASGGDMLDRIINGGPYTEGQARQVVKRILSALKFSQCQGLIHRDIKPDNFLYRNIDDPMDFALADFGIALVLDRKGPADHQIFYEVAGTPGYAAPELYQMRGYGKRSDVFGVDILAYMALSGRSPWMSRTPYGLLQETINQPVKFTGPIWSNISQQGART